MLANKKARPGGGRVLKCHVGFLQYCYSKWFEPRSISSSCSVIVRVSVVLKRTVGDSD